MAYIESMFKTQPFNEQVSRIVEAHDSKSRNLFATTPSGLIVGRAGNSWSSAFWAGYDGMTSGVRVPAKNEIARAWYAAGRKVAARNAPKP